MEATNISVVCKKWLVGVLLSVIMLPAWGADSMYRLDAPLPNRFSSIPDTTAIRQTLTSLPLWEMSNADSTLALLQYTLEQSKQAGYLPGITMSLMHMGNFYNKQGMYAKALPILQDALKYAVQSGNYRTLTLLYNTMGNIHLALGSYEQAAVCYSQAARLAGQYQQHQITGSIYNNFAGVLSRMKQYKKALHYLDLAEKAAKEQGNKRLLANVFANKGTVYMDLQEWSKSLSYFEHLLAFNKQHHLHHATSFPLIQMGNIFLQKDMPHRALTYLEEAKSTLHTASPVHAAAMHITLGKTYHRLGDTKRAIAHLEQAIADARVAGIEDEEAGAHRSLAAVYAATGNYKAAFAHKELHDELRDKIESRDIFNSINQLETRYRTAQKDKELMGKQLLIQQQQRHLEHKNIVIYGSIAGILLLATILISLYRSHRHNQRAQANRIKLLQQAQELSMREKEISELKAVMRGEEKERTRIARDLHDGVVSSLSATRLNFSTLMHRMQAGPLENDFRDTIKQLTDSIQELRITAQNLTSETLLQNGLKEAVESFCDKMEHASGLEIDFQIFGQIPELDPEFELSLYRMTQELIHNAIKHANASLLTVQFSCRNNWLGITIEDNGSGMPDKPHQGSGIASIQSRIKAVSGQMNITSDHSGTTVYLEFDLQQNPKKIAHADQVSHL